jgi:putative glutamine amidotransferase
MHPPRIGIPLSLDNQGRWREGRQYHYIDRRYADAVDRAGGQPLHLPIQSDAVSLVKGLDGLVLPGGDDFPSDRPLPPGVELDLVPADQLRFDMALYAAAQDRGIPILGICYGMQLMVQASGGQLEAHLPSHDPSLGEHRLPAAGRHTIDIDPESLLGTIFEAGTGNVNSLHHQAVRTPGPLFRVVARAEDGVVEAVEGVVEVVEGVVEVVEGVRGEKLEMTSRWQVGVQWHPEKMHDDLSDRLFKSFVGACREAVEKKTAALVGAD